MNAEQSELYERIQAFSLDRAEAQLSFRQRLAHDNGWPIEYAQSVIEEYKKFTFLAIIAEHPVTPSDQVDQAWHLHLAYTRSYWEEFCPHVLQAPLHHDPTLGGSDESQKFDDWYNQTLESYTQFFGEAPPDKIWPSSDIRFGQDLQFVRVNTGQNWVVSKVKVREIATIGIATLFTLAVMIGYLANSVLTPSQSSIHPVAKVLLVVLLVGFGLGCVQFINRVIDFIKNPSRPAIGGCDYGSWGGCGGCGGCGGG
ncbi:MAG: hypothetical protein WBA57_12060 [Elainellaceae cyanobacterium]